MSVDLDQAVRKLQLAKEDNKEQLHAAVCICDDS
jgi:hypothetical protein